MSNEDDSSKSDDELEVKFQKALEKDPMKLSAEELKLIQRFGSKSGNRKGSFKKHNTNGYYIKNPSSE